MTCYEVLPAPVSGAGLLESTAPVNQSRARDGDLAVVHAKVTREGVVIEVIHQIFGYFAEQPLVHEGFSQRLEAAHFIDIHVEVVRVA